GAAGVAAGLASGVGLARLMLPVIATTTALASKLTVPSARFVVGWSSLAIAAALGLGATLLAAALPAWRAARTSTAAVIGGRGVEQPAHTSRLVHIALAASLVVGSVRIAGGYVEAPLEEGVLRELEQVPGVALVVGEHSSDWHYADGPIAIHAVDRRFFLDPRFERWPLVGSAVPDVWRLMAAGEVAIVSTNLSHNLGMALGDFLDIETPSGPLRLRVGGMVDDFLSPRGTVLMSRELYVRHWHDTQIT